MLLTNIYGMKNDNQFVNTLEDNIREWRAMDKLVSDSSQKESSSCVLGILCDICIGKCQIKPHQKHHNPAKRRYQDVKQITNTIMDRTGSTAYTWLLVLIYVWLLLNHTFNATIKCVPIQKAIASTADISPLLCFYWWQSIYCKLDD